MKKTFAFLIGDSVHYLDAKFRMLLMVVILCHCSLGLFAQNYTIDSLTNQVKFQKIFEVKKTQSEIFTRANNWVGSYFSNSKNAIDQSDKETGQLSVKGTVKVWTGIWSSSLNKMDSIYSFVNFDCKFYIKDNKYKVVITNLKTRNTPINSIALSTTDIHIKQYLQEVIEQSTHQFNTLFENIDKYIAAKSEADF